MKYLKNRIYGDAGSNTKGMATSQDINIKKHFIVMKVPKEES
jgi:hypothetical protein